jgi:hypothetical protein
MRVSKAVNLAGSGMTALYSATNALAAGKTACILLMTVREALA